jgi:hypothetical protein
MSANVLMSFSVMKRLRKGTHVAVVGDGPCVGVRDSDRRSVRAHRTLPPVQMI